MSTYLNNDAAFFDEMHTLSRGFNQTQIDVINDLVKRAGDAKWPIGWLAYGLATAWHEARFIPQDEIGKGHGKKYGVPGKHGGQVPYGRGLVQQTWDVNYEWADHICGLNGAMLKNFELANDPDIAAEVLIAGMASGHFTGVGLARYIQTTGDVVSFTRARKIINGQDRAALIAGYAMHCQDALGKGGYHA